MDDWCFILFRLLASSIYMVIVFVCVVFSSFLNVLVMKGLWWGFCLYTLNKVYIQTSFVLSWNTGKQRKFFSDEAKGNEVRGCSCGKELLRDKIFPTMNNNNNKYVPNCTIQVRLTETKRFKFPTVEETGGLWLAFLSDIIFLSTSR